MDFAILVLLVHAEPAKLKLIAQTNKPQLFANHPVALTLNKPAMDWEAVDKRQEKNKTELKALKEYLWNQSEEVKKRRQLEKAKEIEEYRKITQKPTITTKINKADVQLNTIKHLNGSEGKPFNALPPVAQFPQASIPIQSYQTPLANHVFQIPPAQDASSLLNMDS